MRWLYDFYNCCDYSGLKLEAFKKIREIFTLEEIIDCCISEKDCDIFHSTMQPFVNNNEITSELEVEILKILENIFLQVQEHIGESLSILVDDDSHIKGFNLIGFFDTSAIIALHDLETNYYPTFKELYGNALDVDRAEKQPNKVFDHAVLQAFIPILSKTCTKGVTLFNH